MRNVLIGTAAAFVGGGLVVGLQAVFTMAGARYPPIIQGLHCNFAKPSVEDAPSDVEAEAELGEGDTATSPDTSGAGGTMRRLVPTVIAGDDINCYLDAPGADYAAWVVAGRTLQFRSGPLDPNLACQDAQAFSAQSPDDLRLSTCQTFRLNEPGEYRLVMKVAARGFGGFDREQMRFAVQPKTAEAAAALEPPIATRLKATLILQARDTTQTHKIPVSESLNEHGLLPSSRAYSWVVYRLGKGETFAGAKFQANSASNASQTKVSYQPSTRSVAISFTLRSGSFVDPWRGWISGSIAVQVQRRDAAQTVDLPDIDLRLPGQSLVPLPVDVPPDRLQDAGIRLTRMETGTTVDTRLGQQAALDEADIEATLEGDKMIFAATRRAR